METTFLQKLATEINQKHPTSLEDVCMVFPSKRSGLFFKKELAKQKKQTFWAPEIVTIDIFIESLSGLKMIDPLEQLFELYEVHKELKIQPPLSFDRFIDTGKIILADFNDIDMALANYESLFDNVTEHIALGNWDLEKTGTEKLTEKYLSAYSDLPKYYVAYQDRLLKAGKAYQGLVYRSIKNTIEKGEGQKFDEALKKWNHIYVAGLNALTTAERYLFDWLATKKDMDIFFEAESQMLNDYDQESGLFIREFYKKQKEDFKWVADHVSNSSKEIKSYSLNGNIAMARMVGELFTANQSLTNSSDTAIILADEGLLMPVLESLPARVGDVNVTLGFPLGLTTFMSFAEQLFGMQKLASIRRGERHFYFKDVMKVLTNPIIMAMYGKEGYFEKLTKKLVKSNLVWIKEAELRPMIQENSPSGTLEMAFMDWKKEPLLSINFLSFCLKTYQDRMELSKEQDDVLVEQMYFFKTSITKLKGYLMVYSTDISLESIRRIFKHVVSKIQVPFSGEPLAGIQIMGLLETRMLSFKNVVFVSVNEGVIPAKGGSQSFLPWNLRSAFKIQTHRDRESIFAYHFYRILSQAENVHLIYDSSTSGVGSQEKSRFVRQIEQEWPDLSSDIRFSNRIGIFEDDNLERPNYIEKTPDVIANIKKYLTERGLSPSALNTYVESPIDFYYGNVLGIRTPDEVQEDLEHNTFGSIVHNCLEKFYIPFEKQVLSSSKLKDALKWVNDIIQEEFTEVIPNHSQGKHFLSYYSVEQYVKRFIKLDIEFIEKSEFPITLLANELNLKGELKIGDLSIKFGGKADRVEQRSGTYYVIDYKSGAVKSSDLSITNWEDLTPEKYKPKFVQLMMYAWLVQQQLGAKQVISGIYTLRDTQLNLLEAKVNKQALLGKEELVEYEAFLRGMVAEMLNEEVPLKRNEEYQFSVF